MNLGRHRVYRANSALKGVLERILDGRVPDAVVSDIPYNVSTVTPDTRLRRTDYGDWDHGHGLLDAILILARFREIPIWLLSCSDKQLSPLLSAMEAQRRSTRTAVWIKTNPSPRNGQRVPLSTAEVAAFGVDKTVEVAAFGRLAKAWWGGHCEGLEWIGPAPHARRRVHDTQKPLALVARWVELVCPEGGLVLDPFMGSGTTLLACEITGRTCIGVDIEGTDLVEKRWARLEQEVEWAGLKE